MPPNKEVDPPKAPASRASTYILEHYESTETMFDKSTEGSCSGPLLRALSLIRHGPLPECEGASVIGQHRNKTKRRRGHNRRQLVSSWTGRELYDTTFSRQLTSALECAGERERGIANISFIETRNLFGTPIRITSFPSHRRGLRWQAAPALGLTCKTPSLEAAPLAPFSAPNSLDARVATRSANQKELCLGVLVQGESTWRRTSVGYPVTDQATQVKPGFPSALHSLRSLDA